MVAAVTNDLMTEHLATLPRIRDRVRRGLWETLAVCLEPRARVRPSEWAEENVVLSKEVSPIREGPFSCDWKPWQRDVHDLLHDNPKKRGMIALKPAQIGFTRSILNVITSFCETWPGPFLFLISDWRQAAHFAGEHFDPVVKLCPRLRENFRKAAKERRETTVERPYLGGRVDFAGAGSVSAVASRTYVLVAIDEYEVFMDNFPADKAGGGWEMALGRVQAVEAIAKLCTWSHPRRKGQGIHELYTNLSDMRRWVWDCPHCAKAIAPDWTMVRFPSTDEEGVTDPDLAAFHCPHCDQVVTDQERAKAVWPPRLGGTGRFETELDQATFDRRDYVGISIHRLSDPDVTVRSLARRFVGAKSDRDRMAFYNVALGEPFSLTREILTVETIARRVQERKQISVPGGQWGCKFLTVGADVQAPKENPRFYVWSSAWSATGVEYVVDLAKLQGWASLAHYLRLLEVPLSQDDQVVGKLTPRLFALDYGFATSEVLDFSRNPIISAPGGHRVPILPLRYRAHVRADAPALMPPEEKRINPARPELGPIDTFDLHRHTWVDRRISRFQQEDRVVVLCPLPGDFLPHMTANILAPVEDKHGWGNDHQEWVRQKNRMDDWLQAGAFNEAGAALRMGLDSIYAKASKIDRLRETRRNRPQTETPREGRRPRGGEIDPDGRSREWF